jgi:hypothetical protein
MRIDPEIEGSARTMMGHVIREELDDLETQIHAVGDIIYAQILVLCLVAAGYIAIDVCRMRWPSDADLREIARHTAASAEGFELRVDDVHALLSRVALGGERMDQVFTSAKDAAVLPLMVTSTLLLAFRPRDKHWWEYLDVIWNAVHSADQTDPSVLPALMLKMYRPETNE